MYWIKLKTTRQLERAVQFSGSSESLLKSLAFGWLKVNGQPGDYFELVKEEERVIGKIEWTKTSPAIGTPEITQK